MAMLFFSKLVYRLGTTILLYQAYLASGFTIDDQSCHGAIGQEVDMAVGEVDSILNYAIQRSDPASTVPRLGTLLRDLLGATSESDSSLLETIRGN